MNNLSQYIIEKLKLNKDSNYKPEYNYHPQTYNELKDLLRKLLKERGEDADLNDIDVTAVHEMWELFRHLDPHNIDISKWDVSKVRAFSRMFIGCKNFNCDLSEWDMSSATHINHMFFECEKFNCDLEPWGKTINFDKIVTINDPFYGCKSLKKIPTWWKEDEDPWKK